MSDRRAIHYGRSALTTLVTAVPSLAVVSLHDARAALGNVRRPHPEPARSAAAHHAGHPGGVRRAGAAALPPRRVRGGYRVRTGYPPRRLSRRRHLCNPRRATVAPGHGGRDPVARARRAAARPGLTDGR